ncbi:hypothetical protein WAF17_18630 [Bernardetia sp. ABR2-2B]|uniref:hypothetical protein n=1 Tax=Bernardetia sp. ABR2-2B TaxID=3127472 RepID=UPI0030D44C5C
MEILVKTIFILLFLSLVIAPFLIGIILNKFELTYKFMIYLFLSIVITFSISLILGWWSDFSTKILLSYYDYDLKTMGGDRFRNVAAENIERVKILLIRYYGVGWIVKVFMIYVFYLPYILLVYLITYLFSKVKK